MRTLATAAVLAAAAYVTVPAPAIVTASAATASTADVVRPDASTRAVRVPVAAPKPAAPKPAAHFDTPQAAMRYLARAYNRHDDVSLRHVTTAGARRELTEMRGFATDLRLTGCTHRPDGDYLCTFSHGYLKRKGRGHATLIVAPAVKPGWYATVVEGCG